VLPTDELPHFVQGAPQLVHFPAQLMQFVVPVRLVPLAMMFPIPMALFMSVVVSMGSPLHFLGDVMHAGGAEVFDGDH